MNSNDLDKEIKRDVIDGLKSHPQTLPSKYFYDAKGDELFRQIMKLPEYYLTSCEFEILKDRGTEILQKVFGDCARGNLFELGAGDGFKTKLLLSSIMKNQFNITYVPIDISQNILDLLCDDIEKEFPGLKVEPACNDFFDAVKQKSAKGIKNLILFLGSTVGNLREGEQSRFFADLSQSCNTGDYVLTGFDLQKNPKVILAAYNDASGTTKAFNLNLIERLNREVSPGFEPDDFEHYPSYDPLKGVARSFLVPKVSKEIEIDGEKVEIIKGQPIHCETSRKFTVAQIEQLAGDHGFTVVQHYFDKNGFFTDSLWRKK